MLDIVKPRFLAVPGVFSMHPASFASMVAIAVIFALTGPPAAAAGESTGVTFVEAVAESESHPQVTAVGLRHEGMAPIGPADMVILVDTSASQTGIYRQRTLDAVAGILESARQGDRLAVSAVDVAVAPLTEGFHRPGDAALQAAARTLDSRTPLGSTATWHVGIPIVESPSH